MDEEELFATLREELKKLAERKLRGERRSPTFTASDLVGEACARVLASSRKHAVNKASLRALAARAMRQVLVDRARERTAQKRIPRNYLVDLESLDLHPEHWDDNVLLLDELITLIGRSFSARAATAVELRIFAGLTPKEIADELGAEVRTIQRDLAGIKKWLLDHAKGHHGR